MPRTATLKPAITDTEREFVRIASQSAMLRRLGQSRLAAITFPGISGAELAARLGFGDIEDPRNQIDWQAFTKQVANFRHVRYSDKDPAGLDWHQPNNEDRWFPVFAGDPNALGGR